MGRQTQDRSSGTKLDSGVQELLHWLGGDRCLGCDAEDGGGSRYWFWYLNEHYAQSSTLARLRASQGFCAHHTEELLRQAPPSTITTIYRYLLPDFTRALSSGGPLGSPSTACPACAAERDSAAFRMAELLRHLAAPPVAWALDRSSSPCLPHLLTVTSQLSRDHLERLLGEVRERLRAADHAGLGVLLKWGDPGVGTAEPTGLAGATAEVRPALPTLDHLAAVLVEPWCPACIAAHDGATAYLRWLPAVVDREGSEQWADAIWLCRTHHWQLARIDGSTAWRVLDQARGYWVGRIGEVLELLRPGEPVRWLWRWRSFWTAGRKARDACERVLATRPCPACEASETARRRMAALLNEALLDQRTAERYGAGVGLCYPDLRRGLELGPAPLVAQVLRRSLAARLALLGWELEERSRLEAWHVRHEPKGTEQGAWKRAVRQFSGGVG